MCRPTGRPACRRVGAVALAVLVLVQVATVTASSMPNLVDGDFDDDGSVCGQLSPSECVTKCDCQLVLCGCGTSCLSPDTASSQRCVAVGECDTKPCCEPPPPRDGEPECHDVCENDYPPCGTAPQCGSLIRGRTSECQKHDLPTTCCDGCVWCTQTDCCLPSHTNSSTGTVEVAPGYACGGGGFTVKTCPHGGLPSAARGCNQGCVVAIILAAVCAAVLISALLWWQNRQPRPWSCCYTAFGTRMRSSSATSEGMYLAAGD